MYFSRLDFGKPWAFWTPEERSCALYHACRKHLVTKEEVSPYLSYSRLTTFSNFSYGLGVVAFLSKLVKPNLFPAWVLGWGIFLRLNPLNKAREDKKEALL
jgi:hypothetical protein